MPAIRQSPNISLNFCAEQALQAGRKLPQHCLRAVGSRLMRWRGRTPCYSMADFAFLKFRGSAFWKQLASGLVLTRGGSQEVFPLPKQVAREWPARSPLARPITDRFVAERDCV